MMHLKVFKEGAEVHSVELNASEKPELLLGRSEAADIRIQDRAVGREHVLIKVHDGEVEFSKKSKFGKVSLNGKDAEHATLKPGDVLCIAEYQIQLHQTGQKILPQEQLEVIESRPEFEASSLKLEEMQQDAMAAASNEPLELNQIHAIDQMNVAIPQAEIAPLPEAEINPDRTTVMHKPEQVNLKLIFPPGAANVEEIALDKEEIFVGRDDSCEVILNDKKTSRKHLRIYKEGMRVHAQDLDSANGTFVNGHRIQSTVLSGEDILKIGSTEFIFKALSAEYFENENQFEPVYSDDAMGFSPGMSVDPPVAEEMLQDAPADKKKETPMSAIGAILRSFLPSKEGRLIDRFKKQPLPRKIIILCIVFLVMFYAMDEEKPKKKITANRDPAALSADAAFKALPAEKRQFVKNTYQLAFDLFKGKQYERSVYEVDKLLAVLPNGYKDAFDIKNYAIRALEIQKANEEEQRRKDAEEKLRKEISELVLQAEELVKAEKDAEAKEIFAKVLEKDPDNGTILRLRQIIEEREHLRQVQAEAKRDLEFKEKQFLLILQQARELLKKGDFYGSMDKAEEANVLFSTDEKKSKQALALSKKARLALQAKLDPFLTEGRQALANQEWTKARDAFHKALDVDSKNEIAKQGLETVRAQLREIARKIYIDGIVAESISDYALAKTKFKECIAQSVAEDLYYGRCMRKYKRLEMIGRNVAGEAEQAPAFSPESNGTDYIEGQVQMTSDEAKAQDEKPAEEKVEGATSAGEDKSAEEKSEEEKPAGLQEESHGQQ